MSTLCQHWRISEKVSESLIVVHALVPLLAITHLRRLTHYLLFSLAALNFSTDLIGAILIPFGTSGPEIFSSAVGVFFAQNDIGTGAIIGSSVFNVLAIPAACGLAAVFFIGHSIELDEVPILRDMAFYIVSIVVLILVVKDNTVDL